MFPKTYEEQMAPGATAISSDRRLSLRSSETPLSKPPSLHPSDGQPVRLSQSGLNRSSKHTATMRWMQRRPEIRQPVNSNRTGVRTILEWSIGTHVSAAGRSPQLRRGRSASGGRQQAGRGDAGQDSLEQTVRYRSLDYLEGDGPAMASDPRADLCQLLPPCRHRPVFQLDGLHQTAEQAGQIAGQRVSRSGIALAVKRRHHSRVQMTAFLPSSIYSCSVPRRL